MRSLWKIKTEFKPGFFVLLAAMVLLRYEMLFCILFLTVLIHETGHIAAALFFGKSCEKIIIYPIGMTAVLNGFEQLSQSKKIITAAAGPAVNFIIFVFLCFCCENDFFRRIGQINLTIGLFNLLPVFPLDGGRALRAVLSGRFGIINGNKVCFKISIITDSLIFIAGIIQTVLFPYNISLIFVAVYIFKLNGREKNRAAFDFYKIMAVEKGKNIRKKIIKADIDSIYKDAVGKISFDYSLVIMLYDKGTYLKTINEAELIKGLISSSYKEKKPCESGCDNTENKSY